MRAGQEDRSYGLGREHFPRLEDRMRLSAVVAHCGAFCARIEATVKNLIHGQVRVHERDCWPEGAAQELERHQRALGLAPPEVRAAKAHAAEAPAATLGAIRDRLAAVAARSAAQEAAHAPLSRSRRARTRLPLTASGSVGAIGATLAGTMTTPGGSRGLRPAGIVHHLAAQHLTPSQQTPAGRRRLGGRPGPDLCAFFSRIHGYAGAFQV